MDFPEPILLQVLPCLSAVDRIGWYSICMAPAPSFDKTCPTNWSWNMWKLTKERIGIQFNYFWHICVFFFPRRKPLKTWVPAPWLMKHLGSHPKGGLNGGSAHVGEGTNGGNIGGEPHAGSMWLRTSVGLGISESVLTTTCASGSVGCGFFPNAFNFHAVRFTARLLGRGPRCRSPKQRALFKGFTLHL